MIKAIRNLYKGIVGAGEYNNSWKEIVTTLYCVAYNFKCDVKYRKKRKLHRIINKTSMG